MNCLRSGSLAKVPIIQQRLISCTSALSSIFKGAPSTGKKRFRQSVKDDDASYLVNNLAGSNYLKDGEDVKIKADSEYPDWIWKMNLGKPPQLDELDPESAEYWEQLAFMSHIRQKRLMRLKPRETMRIGVNEAHRLEWQERIKFRALAHLDAESGYYPEHLDTPVDRRLWLAPEPGIELQEVVPDQFAKDNIEAFHKPTRAWVEGVPIRSKFNKRR